MKATTSPRRILSMLLVLIMVLTLLPTVALAVDEVGIDETNFPDSIFRAYVKNKFDNDGSGALSLAEINAVTEIDVTGKGITSLEGVEYFTALTKLDCSYNNLTSLDVSNNTALAFLECNGNFYDITLSADNIFNLRTLPGFDVSKASNFTGGKATGGILKVTADEITYAYRCDMRNNVNRSFKLTPVVAIDETNFPDPIFRAYVKNNFDNDGSGALGWAERNAVTEIAIRDKGITSLEGVECFKNLTILDCSGNNLTSLDVSDNRLLQWLHCYNNNLTGLDVSNNTALEYLYCSNNKLTGLDVSNNTALATLVCDDNSYNITLSDDATFDLSTLPGFEVSKAENFTGGNVEGNILKVTANEITYDYNCAKDFSRSFKLITGVAINETNFPDDVFRDYVSAWFDYDNDHFLSADKLETVILINVYNTDVDSEGITSLKGVEYFTKLRYLSCYGNALTSLDLSNNRLLETLDCNHNNLTGLDVSKNTALTELNCAYNELAGLDVSKNSALTELNCSHNNLDNLDVRSNRLLTELNCAHNHLTSLDVSKNTALPELDCSDNSYFITLPANKTFDLSTLPAFKIENASNFVGGSKNENILTSTADEITYDYDCGNDKTANFTLITRLNLADSTAYDIPIGRVNTTYTSTTPFMATGGTGQYTFSIQTAIPGMSINNDNLLVYTRPASATAAKTATIKVTDSADATATIEIDIGEVADVTMDITPTEDGDNLKFTVVNASMLETSDLILVARYDGDGRMLNTQIHPLATLTASGNDRTMTITKPGAGEKVKVFLLKSGTYAPICSATQWMVQ